MTSKPRQAFTFYRSFVEAIELLPQSEQLVAYEMIIDYALDGIEPNVAELPLMVQMLWRAFKPNLDADRRRYSNGCKGGAPKGTINNPKGNNQYKRKDNREDNQEDNQEDNREDNQRKSNVNVNVNENANVNVNENVDVDVNVEEEEKVLRHSRSASAVAEPPCGVKITPPHTSYRDFEDLHSESARVKREQLKSPPQVPRHPSHQSEVAGRNSAYG